jgi:hypothetical protein
MGDFTMATEAIPDLSPTELGRLVAGMATDEVEAILGPYLRPNVYRGRRFYAWIGNGAMLRAFFHGPGEKLSAAVLDVQEGQRSLDLVGARRSRVRRCSIKRTWACVPCRKLQRRLYCDSACPICQSECERVPLGLKVPSPRSTNAWDRFWAQYKTEITLIDAHTRGELREDVKLEIIGLRFRAKRPKQRSRS